MGSFIGILCCVVMFLHYSILNSFFYVVNKKYCYYVNRRACERLPRLIFACLKCYARFQFQADYSIRKRLPEQFLIISNHQSLFDIVAFFTYFGGDRLKFIAKKALGGHVPLVSVMLKTDGHCMIERKGSSMQVMKALDRFSEGVMQHNYLPLLFPEGTRSKTGALGTFHAAGFRRLSGNLKLPVVAFAVDGAWKISNLKKILQNVHGGFYKIKGLKVYPAPEGKQEQVAILEDAKTLIAEQLHEWRTQNTER